MTTKTGK